MILKNGEKYTPTQAEKDKVAKLLDKNNHLVLVWHESRLYTDPQEMRATNNVEKSKLAPPSLPINPEYAVFNDKGETNIYRYYTSKSYSARLKRDTYEPKTMPFKDKMIVTNPEQQLFFGLFCPIVSGSIAGKNEKKHADVYRPWLKIEVEEKVAEHKINKRQLRNQIDSWILEKASEEKIREVSAQYKLSNTQSEDVNILRDRLFKILENTKISGSVDKNYLDFKNKIEKISNPELKDEVASLISKALEVSALKFINQSKSWAIVDDKGKTKDGLLKLNANQVAKKGLILERHLANSPTDMKKLRKAVSETPTKTSDEKEAEKAGDDGN